MAVTNFIPSVWSGAILRTLDRSHIFANPQIVNRDWEGEIRQAGDTVRIQGIGDPTVSNYTRNADIAAPEVLADTTRSLVIDQAKYVHFAVDDVDAVQANVDLLARVTQRVGYQFRDVADKHLAARYVDAGTTTGTDATPIQLTDVNVYGYLVDVATALSGQNVPTEGRWIVLPPWVIGLLSKSETMLNATPDQARNGFVGRVAGFDVFQSANVQTVVNGSSQTVHQIMAGTRDAITFAEQINKIEAYRPDRRFADAIKGLYVFGAKTVLPAALHNLKARQ